MKTSTRIPEIKSQATGPMTGKNSPDITYQSDEQEPPRDNVSATRVCPYCLNTIPASEDPCHHCGHLEPANVQGKNRPANDSWSGNLYFTILAIVFFCFGIFMIISPETNPQPGYYCNLSDNDDCFFPFLVWGRPGGVILIILATIFIGWPYISKHGRKRS